MSPEGAEGTTIPTLDAGAFADDDDEEKKDADQDSEEEPGKEGSKDEGKDSTEGKQDTPAPEEREKLLQLHSQVGEAVKQALSLERQREELAKTTAAEEKRYTDLSSIEDEDERREKLAELGEETLKRREEEKSRTQVVEEYTRDLWADIQRAAPEIGQLFKDKADDLRSAKTDGELIVTVARLLAGQGVAASAARIKELEAALEAQKNAAAANHNRKPPVELPDGTPGGDTRSKDDLKDPIALMSSAFKEAEEEP